MVRLRNTDSSTWDLVWTSSLIFFVIVGIAGVLLTVYAWVQGSSIPRFLIESGPFLLVLVTLINIGLSGMGFLEARKDRRLTRQTLTEYRKEGVIETIVRAIDVLNDELERDKEGLETTSEAPSTYPVLPNFEEPDEELLSDLAPLYPTLIDNLDNYLKLRENYQTRREALRERLSESIPGDLDEELVDDLLKATGSSLESVSPNPESDSFYRRFSHHSEELALVVLLMRSPKDAVFGRESSRGWIDDNINSICDVLLDLRSADEFKEDFEQLEELRKNLISQNQKIQHQCSKGRRKLKDQYNIREAEIKKREER